jgi:uncharacterized protein YjiS (DUF1127 family)
MLIKSRQDKFPSVLDSLIERVAEFIARQLCAFSQRRALHQLARLDDRMLRDIGLFRNDIDAAESLPRGCDPIAFLGSLHPGRKKLASAHLRIQKNKRSIFSLVALSGHGRAAHQCRLSGVKQPRTKAVGDDAC